MICLLTAILCQANSLISLVKHLSMTKNNSETTASVCYTPLLLQSQLRVSQTQEQDAQPELCHLFWSFPSP